MFAMFWITGERPWAGYHPLLTVPVRYGWTAYFHIIITAFLFSR
jgi:hypothetical protein